MPRISSLMLQESDGARAQYARCNTCALVPVSMLVRLLDVTCSNKREPPAPISSNTVLSVAAGLLQQMRPKLAAQVRPRARVGSASLGF